MSKKTCTKTVTTAAGIALASTLAVGAASADQNPFGMTELSDGYMVAGKEGTCAGMKKKAGEGTCAGMKKDAEKAGEGTCAGMKKGAEKGKEGKCGEGKCGGTKK
ncbi:MAG TPA: hypothetical protein ENK62_05955 [Chromatiales bacterium]|nr:hypothetical protein [Chromatiales bacterium]